MSPLESSKSDSVGHQSINSVEQQLSPEPPQDDKLLMMSPLESSKSDSVGHQSINSVEQQLLETSVSKSSFCNSDFAPSTCEEDEHPTSIVDNNKLNGRFLDVESLCQLLQNGPGVKLLIPKGIKEDTFFLIENQNNIRKRIRGERSNYEDDCGAWNSKSSSTKKTIFYHVHGKFKAIDMKNGKYCTMKLKDWVPLDPQPLEENVMVMKRFYTSLKRKPDYKKRVTWIEKVSSGLDITSQGKAVVEYLGVFPLTTTMHGNSKKGSSSEYVRTCDTTKKNINDRITDAPPRKVYSDMVLEDSVNAPRNLKQVQNMKHTKANLQRGPSIHRKNTADDVQTIMNMMNDHPFIQEIVQIKGKPPMVILYTEDQLKDVRNFCVKHKEKTVLGVDRTFNLGACFVTLTVFKNTHLLRRSTQCSPIMLGPLFLHWDGTCLTYQRFFSHLRTKLDANINTEVGFGDLVVGSDEEKAIMKAVHQSFPSATQLLCQRHMEENVRRHLQHKVGVSDKLKNEIVSLIFGKDGLTNAKDLIEFDLKCLSLSNTFLDTAPNFVPYFDNSLVPRVREYIYKPRISNDWIPLNWTNNNCESMNNIIKLSTNWKALKLPDLIEKMYSIVKLQYADIRRALHGHGNYQVVPKLKSFVLSSAAWSQKNDDEKANHFQKFLSVSTGKKTKDIRSTDGELKIPATSSIARKPGQHKRVRTDKTRTQKQKKIKIEKE